MSQPKRDRKSRELPRVHPAAAAIDIGATMHVAAVGPDRDKEPVRTFRTFTDDLHRLADWFAGCGVKTVVMELTGVYWIPVFEILEQRGFEVMVVNARDAKHVPGRKTDVSDAQWLQRLHEYGLLRASFRPQAEIAGLRAYLRQRERLLDYAAAHIQHMQKALMQMNLQLHHVVSDITGVTGMAIIRAIVAGERDPNVLASHRDRRCHASVETVCQALIGNYREEHVFALTQALELYDFYRGPRTSFLPHRPRVWESTFGAIGDLAGNEQNRSGAGHLDCLRIHWRIVDVRCGIRFGFQHRSSPLVAEHHTPSRRSLSAEMRRTGLLPGRLGALVQRCRCVWVIVFNDGMDVLSFVTARGLLTTLFFWLWLRHALKRPAGSQGRWHSHGAGEDGGCRRRRVDSGTIWHGGVVPCTCRRPGLIAHHRIVHRSRLHGRPVAGRTGHKVICMREYA